MNGGIHRSVYSSLFMVHSRPLVDIMKHVPAKISWGSTVMLVPLFLTAIVSQVNKLSLPFIADFT